MTEVELEPLPMTTTTDENGFDPAAFLVTPHEQTETVSKRVTDQAAASAETAYKAALKDKPPAPDKFAAAFAKGMSMAVSDPLVLAQQEGYALLYPGRLQAWRDKHPQHAEREDAEIAARAAAKKKAEEAARAKKRKIEPNTPAGEILKKAMGHLDDARACYRELEKALAAMGAPVVENGKEEKEA